MKFEPKYLIPILLSLLSLFLLCHFRTVPMSQFWKGYRMLYVYSEELGESDILAILENNSCSSVVAAGRQRIPVLSPVAPVQANDADSYIYRRNDFFTDKNHRARVFYIPEDKASGLDRAIRELSAFQGAVASTDGKSSFPWIAPLIACVFFAVLLSFSKRRLLFFSGTALFILFSFCRPLYTVSSAVCLYLFAFFLFHRFWLRKGFFHVLMNSPYVPLFAFSPVLVLLFSSPMLSVFYAVSLFGSLNLVYLYYSIEKKIEEGYAFRPVYIRSARMIPVLGHLGIRLLGSLLLCLLGIFISFSYVGKIGDFEGSASMPSLPAPVSRDESDLVQLSDFVNWAWKAVTFPYRKIGGAKTGSPKEGDSVSITDYVEEGGVVVPVTTTAYVFNDEFRNSVYKSIEGLDYPSLERLMLRQGKNARFAYTKSASVSSSERFAVPLILILLAIPATLGINYIIGRKRYGLSI